MNVGVLGVTRFYSQVYNATEVGGLRMTTADDVD